MNLHIISASPSSIVADPQKAISNSFHTLAGKVTASILPLNANALLNEKPQNMDTVTLSPASVLKQKFIDSLPDKSNAIPTGSPVEFGNASTDEDKDLIKTMIEKGKAVDKTLDVDDVTWGALVYLGETMGITDSAALAELQVGDIFQYANEFMIKKQDWISDFVPEDYLNQYNSQTEFWNAKFYDESGNFGRSSSFQMNTVDATRTNIICGLEGSSPDSGEEKLYGLGASSLMLMAEGFKEGNYNKVLWAYANPCRFDLDTDNMKEDDLIKCYALNRADSMLFYTNSFKTDPNGETYYREIYGSMSRRGVDVSQA